MDKIISLFYQTLFAAGQEGSGTFKNPLGETTEFKALINKVLEVLIDVGIPILVVFIVYAGFKFVTAQGNTTKLEEARKTLLWAVIGGAVLVGAKVIATAIQDTIGIIEP